MRYFRTGALFTVLEIAHLFLLGLYLYNHRQYHRPALGLGVQVLADLVADERLQIVGFHFLVRWEALHEAADALADLVQHLLVLFEVDEAARDDVGIFEELVPCRGPW